MSDALRDVLERLLAESPHCGDQPSWVAECVFCDTDARRGHADDCPWQQARAALDAHDAGECDRLAAELAEARRVLSCIAAASAAPAFTLGEWAREWLERNGGA